MAQDLTVQDNYCRNKAAPDGSSLYYATLSEPDTLKQQLFPLFALHYEIIDCLTVSPDPGVTRLKLHWWSEELERLFQGQPRHPITTRLLPIITGSDIHTGPFLVYMAVIESIISRQIPSAEGEWSDYLSNGLGQIWSMAAKLSPTHDTDTPALIIRNGGTIFTLDLLQNLNLLSARGYNFLPAEAMERYRIPADNLNACAGEESTRLLFESLIREIQQRLDECYPKLSSRGRQLPLYHLIMNRIARAVTDEIGQEGYQLLRHKIALTPIRKLWIACRTRLIHHG